MKRRCQGPAVSSTPPTPDELFLTRAWKSTQHASVGPAVPPIRVLVPQYYHDDQYDPLANGFMAASMS